MGEFLIALAVAVGLIALLVHVMGSKSRYEAMTEEEFEEESRKKTAVGAAMVGFELAWRRHEAGAGDGSKKPRGARRNAIPGRAAGGAAGS